MAQGFLAVSCTSSILFPFACRTEMMGLIGAGNNPMVGMTVAVAVTIEEASNP